MNVLTWNCNMRFSTKYHLVERYDADILIIQECEKLPQDFIKNSELFWVGQNENKGLAVIVKGKSSKLLANMNNELIYFLPIQTEFGLIIGTWAFNRRAKKFGPNASGNLVDALTHYEQQISLQKNIIISGDFNNGPRWDLKYFHRNNFRHINSELTKREFTSTYHSIVNEEFGTESVKTFFHQRNEKKGFFIDYVYSKGFDAVNCEVGTFENWKIYSDHVPVIAEFKD